VTVGARLVAGVRAALCPPPPPPPAPLPTPLPEETEEGDVDDVPGRLQRTVQLVGSVVAPVTLITALMFYVGWVRSNALFQRFGVDAALLQFSNQDYLLRSVDSLWLPVGLLLLAWLSGLAAYNAVRARIGCAEHARRVRLVARLLITGGSLLALLGTTEVVLPGRLLLPALVFPVALGVGVTATYYGAWLLRCAAAIGPPGPTVVPGHPALPAILTTLLVMLGLFWASGEYAKAIGRGIADRIAADPGGRPSVVVCSEKRLYLGGGVTVAEEVLPADPTARFRYRYSRLRLLTAFGDRLFLIPESWSAGGRAAILLVLDSSMRVETGPPAS
jgi:hypothetical protein